MLFPPALAAELTREAPHYPGLWHQTPVPLLPHFTQLPQDSSSVSTSSPARHTFAQALLSAQNIMPNSSLLLPFPQLTLAPFRLHSTSQYCHLQKVLPTLHPQVFWFLLQLNTDPTVLIVGSLICLLLYTQAPQGQGHVLQISVVPALCRAHSRCSIKFLKLRYNFHTIQFMLLKCTIQGFSVFTRLCDRHQDISTTPKRNSISISNYSPFYPLPIPTLICLLSLQICLFWKFYINRIMQYMAFCVWHISLNIMFSRFIRVVAYVNTLFLSMTK